MSAPRPHHPAPFEVGGACPHCSETLGPGVRVVSCPKCGIAQHESCWGHHGGCGSYHCLRGERFTPGAVPPDVVVTPEELEAVPAGRLRAPAPGRRPAEPPPEPVLPAKTSALAVWSLALGAAGVLLLGIPGVVATVLGGLALARIGASRGRLSGTGIAAAGIVLGLLSAVGWIVVWAWRVDSLQDPFAEDFPREFRLEGTPEPIAGALRQTVLVEGVRESAGVLSFGKARWIGSGVVLSVKDGRARIATNRHVAVGDPGADAKGSAALRVRFIGGEIAAGAVRWLAPDGVDLAILECDAPPAPPPGASLAAGAALRVGDPVFAVGSPRGLGWTYTRGVVSAFATRREGGGRPVEVIQTQTPISPGSSGGGLYAEDGRLVGINTWTASGPATEGLHFAIAVGTLRDLLAETGEKPE